MAVSISISIVENGTTVSSNISNVTASVVATWTGGSYNTNTTKPGYLIIDGTQYDFTSAFNTGRTNTGSQTLFTKTVNITHETNGSKTLYCSASYTSGVSSGTVTASASKVLTNIPRESTVPFIYRKKGTLGESYSIQFVRHDSTFKHKIYYIHGGTTYYIAGSSTGFTMVANSVTWTPPANLATKNTAGTSFDFSYVLATYTSGGILIGEYNVTVKMNIPDNATFQPTANISINDSTGYMTTYGKAINGVSKLNISMSARGKQGATIKNCTLTLGGNTYQKDSITGYVPTSAGTLTIKGVAVDTRGLSTVVSASKDVYDYAAPVVSKLKVNRCDADGTDNMSGENIRVVFSGAVTALDNQNTAEYKLLYKKSTDTAWTEVSFSDLSGVYTATDRAYIFPASSSSSYDVNITITDALKTTTRETSASTGFALLNFGANGTSIGIGKVAEHDNSFEFGVTAYDKFDTIIGNGLAMYTGSGTAAIDPNTTMEHIIVTDKNTPTSAFWYVMTMFYQEKSATGNRSQIAIPYNTDGSMYIRYYNGSWSAWTRHVKASELDSYALTSALSAYAKSSHNHSASNITSGTLGIARGGTGIANFKIRYGAATINFSSSSTTNQTISFGYTYSSPPVVLVSQVFDNQNVVVQNAKITNTNFVVSVPQLSTSGNRAIKWISFGV